jgi:hypothetical protein
MLQIEFRCYHQFFETERRYGLLCPQGRSLWHGILVVPVEGPNCHCGSPKYALPVVEIQ